MALYYFASFMSLVSPPNVYELEERSIRYRQQGRLSASAQPATVDAINEIFFKTTEINAWVSLRQEEVFYSGGRSISVPPQTPPPNLRGIPILGRKYAAESPKEPRGSLEDERPCSRPITPEDLLGALTSRFIPLRGRLKEGKAISPLTLECIDDSITEKDLIESRGVEFLSIPIEDKCLPAPQQIDELLKLYDRYAKDQKMYIHFHCAGGKGRSSAVLALFYLLQEPNRPFRELFKWLDSWGNKIQTSKPKKRNDPNFWEKFQKFAQERRAGDLWTSFLAANLVENGKKE